MSSHCVIETVPAHILSLRGRLRSGDMAELQCMGIGSGAALWRSYRASVIRRTLVIGGVVAAVGGCGGSALGHVGHPWMLTAPEVEQIPHAFAREGRRQIAEMLELFPLLQNVVDWKYRKAVRFLELIGFSVDEPRPMGSGLFSRFWKER